MPQQTGKYTEDDVQGQQPIVPPTSQDTFLSEMGKQDVALGKGLKSLVTMTPEDRGSPAARDNRILGSIGNAAYETVATPVRELFGMTQPGRSVLTAPTNMGERVEGALSSAIGGDPAAARAHVAAGQPGAALADLYGIPAETAIVGALLKRFIPTKFPSNEKAAGLLTKAAGAADSQAIDFPKEFSVALPALDATPSKVPFNKMTVKDLFGHVQDTFNNLEQQFNSKFFPIAQQPVQTSPISQELRAQKRGPLNAQGVHVPTTAEDADWNKALEKKAVEFDNVMPWSEVNQQRMFARDRVADFHKQFPSTQGSKMGSNVNIVIDDTINKVARDLVYNKLQQVYAGQVPQDYFTNLKRTESALYDIKDKLTSRTKQLSNMSAKTFLDNLRPHSYVSSHGTMGMALGGLTDAFFPEASSSIAGIPQTGAANKAVQKAMSPKRSIVPPIGMGATVTGRRGAPSLAPEEDEQ